MIGEAWEEKTSSSRALGYYVLGLLPVDRIGLLQRVKEFGFEVSTMSLDMLGSRWQNAGLVFSSPGLWHSEFGHSRGKENMKSPGWLQADQSTMR